MLLLIWQLKDVNLWYYKDWANYQKNVYAIHNIATQLNSGYSIDEKPVCFVNRDYDSFLMSWDEDKDQYEIGESPIVSAVAFCGDITCPELIKLFEYQEYTFLIQPSWEQAQKAIEYSGEYARLSAGGLYRGIRGYNYSKNGSCLNYSWHLPYFEFSHPAGFAAG